MRNRILTPKNKVLILLMTSIISIIFTSLISISSIFSLHTTHAEGLSPADQLLVKTLNLAIANCVNNGTLKPLNTSTISTSTYTSGMPFNLSSREYTHTDAVKLLHQYGTGNTIIDGAVSCQQLLFGYTGDGEKNRFTTFSEIGGRFGPTEKDADIKKRNEFLEALGYTESQSSNNNEYCAVMVYKVSINGVSTQKETTPICIKDNGSSSETYNQKDVSNDLVSFGIRGDNISTPITINLQIKTTASRERNAAFTCKISKPVSLASKNLGEQGGKTSEQRRAYFKELFELSASHINDAPNAGDTYSPCFGYSIAEVLAQENNTSADRVKVLVDIEASMAKTDSLNTGNRNTTIDQVRTYRNTNKPSLPKLWKYFMPNSTESASADPEASASSDINNQILKGYNWYSILNDKFKVLSVVDSAAGCSTVKPQNRPYLSYYKDNESDSSKKEVVYCLLDEVILDSQNNVKKMGDKNPAGVINGVAKDGFGVEQLTARKAVEYLNSINLASVCSADSSFPLCQATPIDCKEDPNKEGCKELAGDNASEEEDGAKGEMSACFQNAGALGWMICPLMYTLRDAVQGIFNEFVEPLIRVDKSIVTNLAQNNDSSAMYKAWSLFRNMANIIFVIALLFVIFSQVTGFGIDNYGIKRLLPKLIVTAIIVNFSYFICGIVVDLSNLIGNSVRDIFENASRDPTFTAGTGSDGLGALGVATGVATGVAAAVTSVVALVTAGSALSAAATSGGLLALILPVLGLAASAFMAGFFALLMLGARQAIIIIMIVTSPIAFVLYALPNTNALFKKWVSLFRGLLLLYPIYCFMVGGGFMAAKLIVKDSTGVFIQLIAGFISIAPYFAVPSMTRNALKGFDAAVNGIAKLQNRVNGGMQFAGKKVMNSETVKASAGNYEFGKQAKFAKKYDGYTQEQFAKMKPGERRRLMNALGVVGKDAQQAATIGAAMSQFKFNTSEEGKARAGAMAMTAEDENQVKAYQSDYIDKNMSYNEAIQSLMKMQSDGYTGNVEEDHKRDLQMRALQRHILSTKDGQKEYEKYLKTGTYIDSNGNSVPASSSERSRAVLARDYVSHNSDLKDKYGITYQQMQSMQGSGAIDELKTSTAGPIVIKGSRNQATNKFIENMDSNDIRTISKNDAAEVDDARTRGFISRQAEQKLNTAVQGAIRNLENDPTQVGELNDNAQNLITNVSGTNLNNLGNRVMEVRDNNGQLIQTMRWAKNGPANGGGNGNGNGNGNGGNGNGNGGGNGGNGNGNGGGNGGNGNGNGNGGPTP